MERANLSIQDNLELNLVEIIRNKQLKPLFQPIVSLRDGSVKGYEITVQVNLDGAKKDINALRAYAESHDRLLDLELGLQSTIIEAIAKNKINSKVFFNVNPNIIHNIKFMYGFQRESLSSSEIEPENLVFQISEKNQIKDISYFKKAIEGYKNQGFDIAIEDLGSGHGGLNMIAKIAPKYLKLHSGLIRGIDKDENKQAIVKSMYRYSKLSESYLVANGVETEAELLKLIEIGVHYANGRFLRKTGNRLRPPSDQSLDIIIRKNEEKNRIIGRNISNIYIGNIYTPLKTLSPNILSSQVNDMIKLDNSLPGFCITQNENVIGVITRNRLHEQLSGLYGYCLHSNKPISDIMCRDFLEVDYKTPIDVVSKMAMERSYDKLYDFITVTKDGKYHGIVTVKSLLEKTIEVEVFNATHLNPLSGLPGNLLIENELSRCIDSKRDYCVLYLDMDNFKAYNDLYGFENGDRVIKLLTDIMKAEVPSNEFIGHIGGDDFVAVLYESEYEKISQAILEKFDSAVPEFYSQEDVEKGFIVTKNRNGIEETFPLLSISIAGVTSKDLSNVYELAEKASEIKKRCKQKVGSTIMIV